MHTITVNAITISCQDLGLRSQVIRGRARFLLLASNSHSYDMKVGNRGPQNVVEPQINLFLVGFLLLR